MSLSSKHPSYATKITDWQTMIHTHAGERIVKEQGILYLPATSGMIQDGFPSTTTIGWKAYDAYRKRAIFHGFVKEGVNALVGIMHHKPPTIELPPAMEPLREHATVHGESLNVLLRKINERQLITGRLGLLPDLPATPTLGEVLPLIALYNAPSIINWDNGASDELVDQSLNLVVLDESESERQEDFEWKNIEKYRVLVLGELEDNEAKGVYKQGVFRETTTYVETMTEAPIYRGNTLDFIPFTFINAVDVVPSPDDPPLMNLANLALAIYRGEADFRQSLFMQGQDTLVVSGDQPSADGNPKSYRTGANAVISLPTSGDAKFIGVESAGLSEQREALVEDKKTAASMAGQLMDTTARGVESGDALQLRVSARTSSLNLIALTGAFGLQSSLRHIAQWIGADPEQVIVEPNLDFADESLEGKTLVDMMNAKILGAPWSLESMHAYLQDKGLTELEFEEEMEKIRNEEPIGSNDGAPDANRGAPNAE